MSATQSPQKELKITVYQKVFGFIIFDKMHNQCNDLIVICEGVILENLYINTLAFPLLKFSTIHFFYRSWVAESWCDLHYNLFSKCKSFFTLQADGIKLSTSHVVQISWYN